MLSDKTQTLARRCEALSKSIQNFEQTHNRIPAGTNQSFPYPSLLLSGQCPCSIRAAVFLENDPLLIHSQVCFSGSLLEQLCAALSFIDLRNSTRSTFDGLYRTDIRDYPESAVNEALLNLVLHRDYSYRTDSFIRLYADRLEFTSIGGLMPGLKPEDLTAGISVCRNPALAQCFCRFHLASTNGSGIRRIMDAYDNTGKTPSIKTTPNTFTIILPNINY